MRYINPHRFGKRIQCIEWASNDPKRIILVVDEKARKEVLAIASQINCFLSESQVVVANKMWGIVPDKIIKDEQ